MNLVRPFSILQMAHSLARALWWESSGQFLDNNDEGKSH